MRALGADRVVVVVGHQADAVTAAARSAGLAGVTDGAPGGATRHRPRGPLRGAALADFDGDVLILYGDVPLIRAETLRGTASSPPREGGATSRS